MGRKEYYLLKFESQHDLLRVLRQGTRVICGEIFMIQPWKPYLNPHTFSIVFEDFEIILHILLPEHTEFFLLRRNVSALGELFVYSDPIPSPLGYSSMSIRVRIDLSQPLIFGVLAPNNSHELVSESFSSSPSGYLDLAIRESILINRHISTAMTLVPQRLRLSPEESQMKN